MIGEKLKELRLKNGLLQKEVAFELDMSITGYCSYENNSRNPTIEKIIKLANFYKVSSDYILGIDEKQFLNKDNVKNQLQNIRGQIKELEKYIDNSK